PASKYQYGAISRDGRVFAYASNERDGTDFDLYVRAVEGVSPARRVYEARGQFAPVDFSPDGQILAALESRSSFDADVHLVDLATGSARRLSAHQGDERFDAPAFAFEDTSSTAGGPRQPLLFALSDRGREFMNLGHFDAQGFHFSVDTPHDVDLLAVAQTRDVLAVAVNTDGFHQVQLYTQRPAAHPTRLRAVDLPPLVVSSMRFSGDGRTLVVAGSRGSSPDAIYRVDVDTGRGERVTASDHAGLDESRLVEPTVEHVASFDGLEIPVLVYRPRGLRPGERAPVVVSVHGGPEGQASPLFSPVTQYLVGHGYIVVTPNVRGSTGYGKRFAHLDDVALREDSVRDLSEVNHWLRRQPDVDPTRIAVTGGSYGGYMTLAAITLYPDEWAAACDVVGIANFRTFLEHTAPYRRALREAEYGSLANDRALLERISPLRRVDQIRTPLMVIHGANDPRVPVGEAEQIVNALRARGQRVEYLRFDNEGHGLARRENRLRGYGEMVRFFDEVLGAARN
ncbi:MAG: S9 family peptidase, partial [Deltaproteobacteria bacterium]